MNSGPIMSMFAFLAMVSAAPLSAQDPAVAPVVIGDRDDGGSSEVNREKVDGDADTARADGESGRLDGRSGPPIPERRASGSKASVNQAAPFLVTRNSIVSMEYAFGRLTIQTEGRAMSQGRAGDLVRIMNLNSKSIVAATVVGPSKVAVK